ncbi:MAG: Uma2 family endonuclease [Cyanobacteria bacterium J06560_6]
MVSTQARTTKISPAVEKEVLPLENGDRLTRVEFERRYAAMPHLKKAELIEGVVYLPPAVRAKNHAQPHSDMLTWIGVYRALTRGVLSYDNATIRLDEDNDPQPDALLRIETKKGGRSSISTDDYIEGSPELVIEIAASSASYDLHDKKHVYRRHGIQEYIVWRSKDKAIDWFSLQEGAYVLIEPNEQGVLQSKVFPGLWLDAEAFISGDLGRVLDVLREGMNTSEHQTFVKTLSST